MQESETPKRSSGLLIAGFVVVAVLIIAALFLPPISLGERLSGGSDDTTPAETADTATPVSEDTPETAVSAETTLTAAADAPALPDGLALVGDAYNVTYGSTDTPINVALPAGTSANIADLYGWDGTAWHFLPSNVADGIVTPVSGDQPQVVALVQHNAAPLAVGAELLPTQELPVETLPLLIEVTAGTLTLNPDGVLAGELVTVPTGPYQQFLRATNTGIIVDTASLTQVLDDATIQASHISDLVSRAVDGGYAGVTLDYQGATAAQKPAFTAFATALADALHAQNLQLAVTLASASGSSGNWDTAGQDWTALGQIADFVYLQLPLNPAAYADNGPAEQMLGYAVHQIDRRKLAVQVTTNAIDGIGEAFVELPNDAALANFGELQFVAGGEEIEPETAVEVALSGTASPLEWDGASLTYKYTYDQNGQTRTVWLGHEAALVYRSRFASRYNLRGIDVRGLGNTTNGTGYAAALGSLNGTAEAPQPTDAAIVWTVRDGENNVLASDSGSNLTFAWDGNVPEGAYSINADFALGDTIASLGSVPITVAAAEEEEVVVEETPATDTGTTTVAPLSPGNADAVVNVGANVRTGPGLGYGTIAGGLEAGSRISLLGRSDDSSWFNILMPDGETEGWIFASLVTVNASVNVADLPVVEAPPLIVSNPGDGGGGTAPAPVPVAPISNSGFELGGQAFGAPYGMMSYAGMTWIKRQHKWSPGQSGTDLAGVISEAHNAGFKILISIPGADHSNIDYNAYAAFVGQVAGLPDPPDAIEIWNEMNIDREWPSGQISGATYVSSMLAPAYNAIKSANSSVMVVSGAPAPTGYFGGCSGGGCDDGLYMSAVAAAGGANYMDCVGIHYNEGIISPTLESGDPRSEHYTRYFWGMVNTYWNAMGGARPLCFTELGYLTPEGYGGLPGGFAWAQNTTVAQQAQWLAEAASLSASSGKVRLMIVWNVDSTTWDSDPQAGYAIIRPGGGCPACESLRQVTGGG
ncbi:MAG: SH3 domain-containing protein [Anaerolineales bacterium]|nr:SH3 domain-containing protein [Anaerolineales bacterium]MCB9005732.1 SH3 domain-containing protein [Ardenticatenaceae bacterium]